MPAPTHSHTTGLPQTLGELRASKQFSETRIKTRGVKDEMRQNLMARLKAREQVFPGIVGYQDTVIPQIVNAVLSKQNFILLGLRGQAKSRILRALTALLDEQMAYVAGCEIRDNPYRPLCRRCRDLIAERGDDVSVGRLPGTGWPGNEEPKHGSPQKASPLIELDHEGPDSRRQSDHGKWDARAFKGAREEFSVACPA